MVIFLGIVGFLVFVASIVGFIWFNLDEKENRHGKSEAYWNYKKWTTITIPLGLAVFIAALTSPVQVGAGERAVLLNFGAVTDVTFGEGIHFKVPITQSVQKLDVTTQAFVADASAASKDLQDVQTSVTVNYRLEPNLVNKTYQTYRRAYESRVVVPGVQEAVKAVTANFDAEELITKRPIVKTDIQEALAERLLLNGMILENLSITDFTFSDVFTQAIEAKVVAAQSALEAENRERQVQVEARIAKTEAEGRANARREQANAERDALIEEAKGQAEAIRTVAFAQAEANEEISASLSDLLIQWRTVDKISDDISVIVLPSGEDFILGPEVLGR